jgi:hypothetical protein
VNQGADACFELPRGALTVDDHLRRVIMLQADQVVVRGGRVDGRRLADDAVGRARDQELADHAHAVRVDEFTLR